VRCRRKKKPDTSGAKQAYKAVGESTEKPLTYYHNNVTATVYLLQIMSDFDCTRLVYSSSATVYGTPPVVPIPETTRLKADSPYGQTKVMCEAVIQDLMEGAYFFSPDSLKGLAELAQRSLCVGVPSRFGTSILQAHTHLV
jgi:UDP-glucose 4-epimerase